MSASIQHIFTPEGSLDRPSAEELQQADKDSFIVAYTTGSAQDGTPYYAFIGVLPSKYREFQEKSAARMPMRLRDYGEILASDYEKSAPAHVIAQMQEKYGYDEQFEEKLREEVGKQRTEASKENDSKRIMDIVSMLKGQQGA